MELKEIIKRNYEATVKRGQITNKTEAYHFSDKIGQELVELEISLNVSKVNPFDPKELADIVLVCHSMAIHFGYDLVKIMEEKSLFNEQRPD